ncbi:MAG: PilZ domain-containing protein [Acidobacteriota bacterium]
MRSENNIQVYKRELANLQVYWQRASSNQCVRIGNISVGGCFITTNTYPVVGEIVNLDICLPMGRWLSLQAKVIHIQSNGFGVCFLNPSNEDKALLANLVDFLSNLRKRREAVSNTLQERL